MSGQPVPSARHLGLLERLVRELACARASRNGAPLIAAIDDARALLPALPAAFEPFLLGIGQRLESSAMFTEESCSFSVNDLYDSLETWCERARLRLTESAGLKPDA